MPATLSKVKKAPQGREMLHRSGRSVKEWAMERGFSVSLTYAVLAGKRKCLRGQSHKIAVELGIKDGEITG